jgi:hypothetical protein
MSEPIYEVVLHLDKEWFDQVGQWLSFSDMDAEANEVCVVKSVTDITEQYKEKN